VTTSTSTVQPGRHLAGRLNRRATTSGKVRGAAGTLLTLAGWEAAARTGLVDSRFLPPPSGVLPRAAALLTDQLFLREALAATVLAWLAGLAAAAIAIPLGAVLGAAPAVERAVRPVIEVLRPIPAVALLPVVILAFGIDARARTVLVAFAATWPILLNTIAGVRACEPELLDVARVHGHTPVSVLARVRLPAAAPLIATGLRISASIALIATISLELVTGTDDGLGGYLYLVAAGGDSTDTALAVAVLAGLLGLTINTAATAAERAAFSWHPSQHRSRS
jgi:NitT/TauT family transport system permease protein